MSRLPYPRAEALEHEFCEMKLAEYRALPGDVSQYPRLLGYYGGLLTRVMAGELNSRSLANHMRYWLGKAAECPQVNTSDAIGADCPSEPAPCTSEDTSTTPAARENLR